MYILHMLQSQGTKAYYNPGHICGEFNNKKNVSVVACYMQFVKFGSFYSGI